MADEFRFTINKKLQGKLGRAGVIDTAHGKIQTPAFITVGTKATVKAVTVDQLNAIGVQAVLSNTYHLYLQPGDELVKKAGGLHRFMNWDKPTFTDSGGFQVFSLGSAFGKGVTKIASKQGLISKEDGRASAHSQLAKIDDDGVTFKSHIDGSTHRFTPERSIEIQHNIGADIIVAFDECTSPNDTYDYQKQALARTYKWAERSLAKHKQLSGYSALYGVIQGGSFEDLRKKAANDIGALDFDGFGIGGSFTKDDIGTAVRWVNEVLPEGKPRHLLGIGEPIDLFLGIENGVDTFDCVSPTRLGRNGAMYTRDGRINIHNSKYVNDLESIDADCKCLACANYTRAYVAHLFRSEEMLGATLASIHNITFITRLVDTIRQSILDDTFGELKQNVLSRYYKNAEYNL